MVAPTKYLLHKLEFEVSTAVLVELTTLESIDADRVRNELAARPPRKTEI